MYQYYPSPLSFGSVRSKYFVSLVPESPGQEKWHPQLMWKLLCNFVESLALSSDWMEVLYVSLGEGLSVFSLEKGEENRYLALGRANLKHCITNDQSLVSYLVGGLYFTTLSNPVVVIRTAKGHVSRSDVCHFQEEAFKVSTCFSTLFLFLAQLLEIFQIATTRPH